MSKYVVVHSADGCKVFIALDKIACMEYKGGKTHIYFSGSYNRTCDEHVFEFIRTQLDSSNE